MRKLFFIITSLEYILRDIFVRAVFLVLGNLSTTCKLIEMATWQIQSTNIVVIRIDRDLKRFNLCLIEDMF